MFVALHRRAEQTAEFKAELISEYLVLPGGVPATTGITELVRQARSGLTKPSLADAAPNVTQREKKPSTELTIRTPLPPLPRHLADPDNGKKKDNKSDKAQRAAFANGGAMLVQRYRVSPLRPALSGGGYRPQPLGEHDIAA